MILEKCEVQEEQTSVRKNKHIKDTKKHKKHKNSIRALCRNNYKKSLNPYKYWGLGSIFVPMILF